jgi:hypothetical protein
MKLRLWVRYFIAGFVSVGFIGLCVVLNTYVLKSDFQISPILMGWVSHGIFMTCLKENDID